MNSSSFLLFSAQCLFSILGQLSYNDSQASLIKAKVCSLSSIEITEVWIRPQRFLPTKIPCVLNVSGLVKILFIYVFLWSIWNQTFSQTSREIILRRKLLIFNIKYLFVNYLLNYKYVLKTVRS